MIRQDIDVAGKWTVIVVYDAPLGDVDVGFTYSDMHRRRSVVGISPVSSKAQLLNTIVHEAKHVQSHICSYYGVEEDGEDAAYLIGYLVEKMYAVFRHKLSTGTYRLGA